MQIDQIPRALCHSLLIKLREDGVEDLPAQDNANIDAALGGLLDVVEEQCRQADAAGNTRFVDECLYVLDKLGPDAATGRHDLFWAQIRELQPGSLSFGNPTYKLASLPDHLTEDRAYELNDSWKKIVNASAQNFLYALGDQDRRRGLRGRSLIQSAGEAQLPRAVPQAGAGAARSKTQRRGRRRRSEARAANAG